ncbi:putative S-locus lectin protein kinase family protein [Senna tora]|uniref:Putative S-locus lectin protein kinase family protein n=1 Tax=Senna tora TaxID=362788 RepID=A0A835C8I9_9FABA|nr:putative S-locus lectin protein kinase family protein [Senna tora]
MASRKRKATASSSSSGTIAERFASPDAAKRYKDIFSKSKAISERGLSLNKENNDDKEILDMVDTLEWKKFTTPPKQQGHLTIVREFYANFKDRKDNKVNVRGVEIPFSREDIIKFYNLPNLPQEECGYHALQEQEAPDYGAIAEKLGKEADTSWENSKAKRDRQPLKLFLMNLKDVVSLWQHFICAHIIPGGNTSVVTKERAFLLYCIVTGQHVDVAEIMINQVVQVAEKTNPTLFFPCLITALCKKAHVKFPDTDALMSKKQQEAFAPHLESASSSFAQPEADHLIRELLERQERYHQGVMAEMKYLRAQLEAVDAHSKYNSTCFGFIHHNLSQLIKHSEDKAHTPEYHDLPPPPPES